MSLDFTKPATTDLMAQVLTDIRDMQTALAKLDPSTATGLPTGTVKWSTANNRFETWNSSAWVPLMPDASTTVRGPTILSSSVSSPSTVVAANSLAVKTVQDSLTTGLNALDASKLASNSVPVARLPAATTAAVGAVQLLTSVASVSETLAATPKAVKTVNDSLVAGLAALNGSNISSGTVPAAYLPAVSALSGVCTDAQLKRTAAPSNHVRAGNMYIPDCSQILNRFSLTSNVTAGAWETVGPTGSGADNIWSLMDNLLSTARILIVDVDIEFAVASGAANDALVKFAMAGITPIVTTAQVDTYLDINDTAGGTLIHRQRVFIPLSANRIFQVYWNTISGVMALGIGYQGFLTD